MVVKVDICAAHLVFYLVGSMLRAPGSFFMIGHIGRFHEELWFPKLSETFQKFRNVSVIGRSII